MERSPHFLTISGAELSVSQVVGAIIAYIREEPFFIYKITLGTDSEQLQGGRADFVTAVVVHRVGNGGKYFWHRGEYGKFRTLRERITREVLVSLDFAREFISAFEEALLGSRDLAELKWSFEIHVDAGEHGPTSAMLQELVGMIRANNFAAVTKPGSYAASSVADRHV